MDDSQFGSGRKGDQRAGLRMALIAIMTAVTVVFTLFVRIPTSKGYFNLCDVAIYFCAFTFNPLVTFVSAAVGTALADIISGYPQWAAISFVVHGCEGLVVALILKATHSTPGKALASTLGAVIVAGGYFLLGGAILTDFPTALVEVPANIAQSVIGAVFGFIVSAAVAKAYPPVRELSR